MNEHNRFSSSHRAECADCRDAYADFMQEQAAEAYLDKMAEVISPDEFDPDGVYGTDDNWK